LKRKASEEEKARKTAEASAAKLKNDSDSYRERKAEEKKQFAVDAQRAAD